MIRHINSLLLSLILHSILFVILFYTAKTLYFQAEKKDKLIPLKLCNVACEMQKSACNCNVPQKKEESAEKKVETEKVKKVDETKQVAEVKKRVEVVQKSEAIETPPLEKMAPPPIQELPQVETSAKVVAQALPMQETKEVQNQRLEKEYLDENMQQIIKLLQENLYYPRSARKRGATGKVIVKFCLDKNGEVQLSEVLSSENEILSRAAIQTIENLSGSFPKPKERLLLRLPINYNLNK